jgi:hypothetical protein
VSSPHSWHPRRCQCPRTYILSELINNQRGAPTQASFSGQTHRLLLQVTVRFRWRLTVFQQQARRPAAGLLCRGRCCRSVSPDASSTSISCDAVHGRRRLYMLGPNLQTDPHIDITVLLLTSLHAYSSHVFVLEWCGEWYWSFFYLIVRDTEKGCWGSFICLFRDETSMYVSNSWILTAESLGK